MKQNVITVVELEKARKKAARRKWVADKAKRASEWIIRNKEMLVVYGPLVIGTSAKLVRFAGKKIDQKKDKDLHDLYCYDRSLGHYWKLKRELKNREWLEIEKRRQKGERLADILKDMNVLR